MVDCNLDRLALIAADLRAGEPLSAADARLAACVLEASSRREAAYLRDARIESENLIIAMAEKFAAHLVSARAKATLIAKIARRYEASGWRFHRDKLRLPDELRETPERFVWTVLKTLGEFPGYEKIRKIL